MAKAGSQYWESLRHTHVGRHVTLVLTATLPQYAKVETKHTGCVSVITTFFISILSIKIINLKRLLCLRSQGIGFSF